MAREYAFVAGTRTRRLLLTLLVPAALAAGSCGGEDQRTDGKERASGTTEAATPQPPPQPEKDSGTGEAVPGKADTAALARRPPGAEGLRVPARRARIVAKHSPFGRVLFDANGQVVYVFENDRPGRSNCTNDECVEAWPPVLTRSRPTAGAGVEPRLLGTIRRGDGGLQVTYGGRPLYFYEHEGPGEIKCHNVELHGGLWWVLTPGGAPAA